MATEKRARVLLVDDEQLILNIAETVLREHAFEVLTATSWTDALEIVNRDPPPDLVISDLVMPGMQGPELLDEVKHVAPDTARVLMSGYGPPMEFTPGILFLAKPFTPDRLIAAIELALSARQRPVSEL
jgi:two-component system cell cycle sensor histidine kinase/response regulator CckA